MRIGMMADVYKPHVSGVTNYISLNRSMLEKAGHEVFIFTFGDDSYHDDETNVIRTPGLPLVDSGITLALSYTREARRLLHTMDIVHVHHPFISGSLALRYCRPYGIPIVFTNHTRYDLYAQAYLPAVADVIGESVVTAFLPPFCRGVDLVIAPSEGMRKVLRSFGVDSPVEVVPNGVSMERFAVPLKPLERSRFGFKDEDVLLVYAGRLGPEKNLSFLLRSFAGAAQALDTVRLLIVGDGSEREIMEEQANTLGIRSKVFFAGMVPYEEVPGYLVSGDIFVTASVTEVHPLSVIEGMAAGLPVLGIQSPGVGDTVISGETGLLSTNDVAAFTAMLVRLAMDSDMRSKMAATALQKVTRYDIRRTSMLVCSHYEQLVKKSAGRKRGWRTRFNRFLENWRP